MLKEKLTDMLKGAMKNKESYAVACIKAIKAEFLVYEKAPGAKPLDETAEINILKKMVKQRQDSATMYTEANRADLATNELVEANYIQLFIPKPATEEEILYEFDAITAMEIEPIKKNMSKIINAIKSALPNADGKMVAKIVSSHLS